MRSNIAIEGYDDDGRYHGPECIEDEYRQQLWEKEMAELEESNPVAHFNVAEQMERSGV